MFWKKKPKKQAKTREKLLKDAKKAAATKREEIGDETLEKIRQAITQKETSKTAIAKQKILDADQDKVRDHLQHMIREKDRVKD